MIRRRLWRRLQQMPWDHHVHADRDADHARLVGDVEQTRGDRLVDGHVTGFGLDRERDALAADRQPVRSARPHPSHQGRPPGMAISSGGDGSDFMALLSIGQATILTGLDTVS